MSMDGYRHLHGCHDELFIAQERPVDQRLLGNEIEGPRKGQRDGRTERGQADVIEDTRRIADKVEKSILV